MPSAPGNWVGRQEVLHLVNDSPRSGVGRGKRRLGSGGRLPCSGREDWFPLWGSWS